MTILQFTVRQHAQDKVSWCQNMEPEKIKTLRNISLADKFIALNHFANFDDSKHKICMIPKNANTLIKYTNCFLFWRDNKEIIKNLTNEKSIFQAAHFQSPCFKITNMDPDDILSPESSAKKHIAIIRNPFSRFLSGWMFTCLREHHCLECDADILCFVGRLYECLSSQSRSASYCKNPFVYMHFIPQIWHCNLDKHVGKYEIIKYNKVGVENLMKDVVTQSKISNKHKNHLNKVLFSGTEHETKGFSYPFKSFIVKNDYMVAMLSKIYADDFAYFNLNIPNSETTMS